MVIVQAVLDNFFTYMKTVQPLLLQDTEASEAIISGLEGHDNSIRCFGTVLNDRLK